MTSDTDNKPLADKIYALDEVRMTALRFAVVLEIFALKVRDACRDGKISDDKSVQDFAYDYAINLMKANLKPTRKRK